MCKGALIHHVLRVRGRRASPGSRMRRLCAGDRFTPLPAPAWSAAAAACSSMAAHTSGILSQISFSSNP